MQSGRGEDPCQRLQAPGGLAEVEPGQNQRLAQRCRQAHVPAESAARAPPAALPAGVPEHAFGSGGLGCGEPEAALPARAGLRGPRMELNRAAPATPAERGAVRTLDPDCPLVSFVSLSSPRMPGDPVSSGSRKNSLGLNVNPGNWGG